MGTSKAWIRASWRATNPQPEILFSNRVGQLAQLDYVVEAKTAVKHYQDQLKLAR